MKERHTPGPWSATGLEIRAQNNMILANVYEHLPSNQDMEEAEANAKLIAEAPEMLKALKEIAKGEGRYDLDPLRHAGNTIEDMKLLAAEAIKKATE